MRTHNPDIDDAEAFRRTVVIISLLMGWSLFRRYCPFGADATGDSTILDADLALLPWAGTTITMAPPTGRGNAEPEGADPVAAAE